MTTWFISDLHLDPTRPHLADILLRFLDAPARAAKALYILGDLFEAWVGDDGADVLADSVAGGLRRLSDAGVEVGFQCGNRDFLLGAAYSARCGMRRLPDPCVVDLYGRPTLLTHGDALCTGDLAYQAFRRQVRDPAWQVEFLGKPLSDRLAFAAKARAASTAHQQGNQAHISDVEDASVETQFARFGVDRMIHGHTHRPGEHHHRVDDRVCERIVLSDWRAAGEALVVSASGTTRVVLG